MAHTIYKTKSGEVVPSVTTVISKNLGWNKDHLIGWAKKLAKQGKDSKEVVQEAADIGTLTHKLIETKIKNEDIDLSQYPRGNLILARNGLKGFIRWEEEWKPQEYIHNEVSLVSETYKYGGTIDIVAKKDDKLHILDCKTTNHLHPEMMIQLAAYKKMYEEVFNTVIESCSIIKLEKNTPSYTLYPITNEQLELGWNIFHNLIYLNDKQDILEF